jgi:DNA-binding response OmpR family regulator
MSRETAGRVLIVEDEMMVSMLLEDMLDELGYQVVGPVADLNAARAVAERGDIDAAILDVNLNGQDTFPLAQLLSERDIPFVFATGYGTNGVSEHFRHTPALQKPFQSSDLARALRTVLARRLVASPPVSPR